MSPLSEEDLTMLQQNVRRGTVRAGGPLPIKGKRVVPDGASAAPSPFRSKWEAAFAAKLELEKRAGLIKAYYYEPFSLWLPGKVRYKPDFLVQHRLPQSDNDIRMLELIEVKGFSKNRRDGITRMKIAAALFPCFVWRMVWMKKGGGFDGMYL